MRKFYSRIYFIFFILFLISPKFSLSQESPKKPDEMHFLNKAEKREKLSIEEFKLLLSETGNKILAFQKVFSELRIEDGNFDYSIGKHWEFQHKMSQESFQESSQILVLAKKDSNKISYSLALYILMVQMNQEGFDFSKIPAFKAKLVKSNLDLLSWRQAFLKAHLIPLSIAKDKNEKLY